MKISIPGHVPICVISLVATLQVHILSHLGRRPTTKKSEQVICESSRVNTTQSCFLLSGPSTKMSVAASYHVQRTCHTVHTAEH